MHVGNTLPDLFAETTRVLLVIWVVHTVSPLEKGEGHQRIMLQKGALGRFALALRVGYKYAFVCSLTAKAHESRNP